MYDSLFTTRKRRGLHPTNTAHARRHRFLRLEALEPRQLLAADPLTSLAAPSTAMIGQTATIDIGFSNASLTDTGYGPYVDIYLPTTGADGAGLATDDGLSFVGATYLGQSVSSTVLTFDDLGEASHPLARDASGNAVVVHGTPGDQLVVLQLPFGSYTPGQPEARLHATVLVSSLADTDAGLPIQVGGGFRFGDDPNDNPTADPSIIESPLHSATLTPTVYRLIKTYSGPENETATGPNFPRQYTITADLADGAVVTQLNLTDILPDDVQFVSVDSTLVHGAPAVADDLATPSTSTPGGTIARQFATVTGTSGTNDASFTFTFYIPQTDASSANVLSPVTGNAEYSDNHALSSGLWTPSDPRDLPTLISVDPAGIEHRLTDRSIAIQKSSSLWNDLGAAGLSPGDTVEYTLRFQISDYFSFGDLAITDILSDGQRLDPGFAPSFSITDRMGTVSGNFTDIGGSPDLTIDLSEIGSDTDPDTDGSTRIVFDLSQALLNAGELDGVLQGGFAISPPAGAATGLIHFRAVVQEEFSDTYLPNTPNVSEGDSLTNHVTIEGTIRDNSDVAIVLDTEQDTSQVNLTVVVGSLTKSVYAINGNTTLSSPIYVSPGDEVTYRFTYSLPMTDFDGLSLVDYLPLPIFDATTLTTFSGVVSAAAPAPGTLKHGPTDTFFVRTGLSPSLTTSSTANSFTITYPGFDDPGSQSSVLDLLATFVVSDIPFTDQLILTNQIRANQFTTNASDLVMDKQVQVVLTEPELRTSKGTVAKDATHGSFAPATIGPVSFSAPGSVGTRFSGTINSTNLATSPINSNVSGVDAADIITFAIVIENTGTGLNGAFDVQFRDTLPTGFAVPAGGLNLTITDGAGSSLPYSDLGGGLFGSGLELLDSPGTGAIAPYHATNGRNIVIITYDLQLESTAAASATLENTATLSRFAGVEGGADHTPVDLTDIARTTLAAPTAAKNTPDTQAVIGQLVTFNVVITVPEGTSPALQVVDTLDSGLAFVELVGVTTSNAAQVSWTTPITQVIGINGQTVTLGLGNVVNTNSDNSVPETVTLTYRAVVLNVLANQQGTNLNNSAIVSWTGGALPAVSSTQIGVVEPNVTTTKTATVGASGTVGDAGDAIQYVITLRNTSGYTAYDVTISDSLPLRSGTGSLIVSPTFTVADTAGLVTAADFELVGDNTTGWILQTPAGVSFDMAHNATRTISITVNGTLAILVRPDETITNTVQSRFTSRDGEPGTLSIYNANSTERTGANGPGAGLNNYANNGAVNIDIYDATPVKSLPTSSESTTLGNALTIGEVARFRIYSRLAEGTATTFQLIDQLPTGMRMLNDGTAMIAFVSNGGGITSSTIPGSGMSVAGNELTLSGVTPSFVFPTASVTGGPFVSGTDPTFNFGTLVNSDSDADQEFVVLEFNALVENIATNQAGTTRANTSTVRVNAAAAGSTSNTVNATLVEPSITNLVKTANPTTGDAGDTISYRITFSNPSAASVTSAFDLRLTDTLPVGLRLNLASITTTVILGGSVTDSSAGNTIDIQISSLAPNGTVQIDYTAELLGSVQPEQSLLNTATLVYTSLPGDGTTGNPTGTNTPGPAGSATGERTGTGGINDYNDTDDATVTVDEPAFSKIILTTNQSSTTGTNVTIGELIEYELTFAVVEGVSTGVTVLDQFPLGMAIVSLDSITASPSLSTSASGGFSGALAATTIQAGGHEFEIDLQNIANSDVDNSTVETVQIRYTAVVLNVVGNQNGSNLINTATVAYSSGDVTTTAPAVRVVEPDLNTTKSASQSVGDAGGAAITFQIVVSHDALSTTDAMNVSVRDVLPTGFDYVPASLTHISGVAASSLTESSGTFTATYDSFPLGSTSTWSFAATLNDTTTPGQSLTNTAVVTYTSLPGSVTNPLSAYNNTSTERTGSTADPGGTVNDYLDSDSTIVTVRSNSVSGSVFVDATNNGIRDLSDSGIASVILALSGTDNLGNAVTANTTTDLNGGFAFTGLRPGVYRVVETQPTGYLDGIDTLGSQGGTLSDDQIDFTLPLGVTTVGTGNLFGELAPASVSGFVFADRNNDGSRQLGEDGIASVSIRLTGTDDRGNPVDVTVLTNSSGQFDFTNLRPGTYSLNETQPTGYLDGRDTVGTQGGTLGNDTVTGFVLGPGAAATGTLFGELPPARLAGYVYEDLNESTTQDTGEAGIAGVSVRLSGIDDLGQTVDQTATTASDGTFAFENLRPGTYSLTETQPTTPFYFDGLDTAGSLGGSAGNDAITNIAITPGQLGSDYRFGELPPADPTGFVYVDANNNGVRDTGEPPIPGVLITVTGIDDLGQAVLLTDTTDSQGRYQFAYLRPGTYRITETQPASYIDGQEQNGTPAATIGDDYFDGLTLTWGQLAGDYNFGELAFGRLAGRVYVDTNRSGLSDAWEMGIAGVVITLTGQDIGGNSVLLTQTTDAQGEYAFDNLVPGLYRLTETQPTNYLDGLDTVGSLGGQLLPDAVDQVILSVNDDGVSYDFGENGLLPGLINKQYFLARNRPT